MKNMNGKKNSKKWFFNILFLASLAVFLYAGTRLVLIFTDYQKGASEYDGLKQFTADTNVGSGNAAGSIEEEKEGAPSFTVDFPGLKAQNEDTIGWLRFENLDISYPVMQGTDNDYYLNYTFSGEKRTAASIFLDYQNSPDFSDNVSIIYGHNMKDGTMFAKLNQYAEEEFYQENPDFWIYTPQEAYRYDIFSCYLSDVEDEVLQCGFTDAEGFEQWLTEVKGKSNYDTERTLGAADKVVMLMTCNRAGDEYRFLVYGVQREVVPVE